MRHKVALFVTCLTDQFYPRVGVAVTKILEHFGCEMSFPDAQTCCGQPFYNNGFQKEAEPLARRFVEIFEPYEYIVSPSGSCAAMVREHYGHLLEGDVLLARKLQKVTENTYEFVEFLHKVLQVDLSFLSLPVPTSVTYHYTCHLRGLGMKDEAVGFLKQIKNLEFRPLEKTDQCCGFGGTFAVKYPAISGAIVRDKAACIEATGASTTIVNDAGCSMNIAGTCHRHGVNTRVAHIAEIIAEAMGLDLENW